MKPLSEALSDLAGRVKKLETSSKSGFDSDRAELERSLDEIGSDLDAGASEFEDAVREADARGSTWWKETRTSTASQLEDARSRYQREAEVALADVKSTGNVAEIDARAAVALANYCLAAAEYSIADAALKALGDDGKAAPKAAASN